MAHRNEESIYDYLYDNSIEDPKLYSRKTLCIWIRATILSAISEGIHLGIQRERDRVIKIIKGE